jgi:hypothetical protein
MQLNRHNRQQQFLPLPTGTLFTVYSTARFVYYTDAHYKGKNSFAILIQRFFHKIGKINF